MVGFEDFFKKEQTHQVKGQSNPQKPSVLLCSEAKFEANMFAIDLTEERVRPQKCTLLSDKKLLVDKKVYDLSQAKEMKIEKQGDRQFVLISKTGEERLHFLLCDEAHSFLDWYLELKDLLPLLKFTDLTNRQQPAKFKRKSYASKYTHATAQKFNDIPILLIQPNSLEIKSSYLITKTLKQFSMNDFRFDTASDKIHGAQGKFRAAMKVGDEVLLGVKEVRFEDKMGAETGATDIPSFMGELKNMQVCKCRLKIHDVMQIDQKAYCVMDYLEGSLVQFEQLAHSSDPLKFNLNLPGQNQPGAKGVPADRSIGRFLLKEVALDLQRCHAAGYVHRDVKPDNVFVGRDRAVLADYGNSGSDKEFGGTPHYMPAYNYDHKFVDKPVDIYNLGLTWLYYMTGKHLLFEVKQILDKSTLKSVVSQIYTDRTNWTIFPHPSLAPYHVAAIVFEYFYNHRYSDNGDLLPAKPPAKRIFSKPTPPPDLTAWNQIETLLAKARQADPEVFKYVWQRMLHQDPSKRATAMEVYKYMNSILTSVRLMPFNHVIMHPKFLMKRQTLELAFKEAQSSLKTEPGKWGIKSKGVNW